MARRRVREADAPVVELPDRLAVCWVEDWIGAADYSGPSHWPTDINGRPPAEVPGELAFHLERTALRRWQAARLTWAADRGRDSRTFATGRPRWRNDPPNPQPPPTAA